MCLSGSILPGIEGLQGETVLPLVRSDSVFGMYLRAPSIVAAYTHLLMVDVEPHHIFLQDASSVAALCLRRAVFDVLHRDCLLYTSDAADE